MNGEYGRLSTSKYNFAFDKVRLELIAFLLLAYRRDRSTSHKNASPSTLKSLGRGVRALGSTLRDAIDSRKLSIEKGVELMEVFDGMVGSTAALPVVSPGVPDTSIPTGHTSYSWQAIASSAIPSGHTPFSWRYNYSSEDKR